MKIIFMGTPNFAVNTLDEIYKAGHDIQLVVTQPDKPFGRGKKIKKSEVKQKAEELNLEVFQPEKIRKSDAIAKLEEYDVDLIIVVAYGQILSKKILDMPKFGCINVHASLLPKLRGAAPINWSIINGDKKSGVTTMMMDIGLDTGDMLLKSECEITENMNAGELNSLLSNAGAKLLIETINKIIDGSISRIPQNHDEFTYAPMLDKSIAMIDWQESAEKIHNKIRGLNPDQVAWFKYNDNNYKVFASEIVDTETIEQAGKVIKTDKKGLLVATGKGVIKLLEIQAPGKKKMRAVDYLRGNKIDDGVLLI